MSISFHNEKFFFYYLWDRHSVVTEQFNLLDYHVIVLVSFFFIITIILLLFTEGQYKAGMTCGRYFLS